MARRRFRVIALLLVFAFLLVTGCANSGTQKSTQGAAESKPSKPKLLTIAQGVDLETLDPHGSAGQATINVTKQIAEPLMYMDYTSGKVIPWLAESWKMTNDTTWQIKLRQGVKFSDGEELTADTIKFNVDRLIDPATKSPVFALLSMVNGAEVVDKNTVNIRTKDPFPLLDVGLTRLQIIPKDYFNKVGQAEYLKKPIGTGPFKFVQWVKDDRIVLEANPNYWGGKPALDKVVFRPIPESAARVAALRAGEVDIITNVQVSDMATLQQEKNLQVMSVPGLRLLQIMLDGARDDVLKDKRVRQALNYAVDKEAIINKLLQGKGVALPGQLLSKEYIGFSPDLKPYPYDPAKARQLLAEAGHPNGITITLYTPQGRYIQDKEIAEAVAGQLADVGVKVNVQVIEWANLISKLLARTLGPAFLIGYSTQPDAYFQLQLYLSDYRASYYNNPDYDKAVKDAIQTIDVTKRTALYQQASKIQNDDPPAIFLHQQIDLYGANKRVSGWKPQPDERIDLTGVTVND